MVKLKSIAKKDGKARYTELDPELAEIVLNKSKAWKLDDDKYQFKKGKLELKKASESK